MPLDTTRTSTSINDLKISSNSEMTSPEPTSKDGRKLGYLFGYPIKHSLSPIVHQLVYKHLGLDYSYTLYESTSIESFLTLTRAPNFYGAAVTMPYKVAIIPHLAALTPEGHAVGAVNTIFLSPVQSPSPHSSLGSSVSPNLTTNGTTATPTHPPPQEQKWELHGTNTDCIGIREALRQNMVPETYASCAGKSALIIGGGGTCRAAVYALTQWLHSSRIYILNRDAAEVAAVIAECKARGIGGGGSTGNGARAGEAEGGKGALELIHIESVEQARSLKGAAAPAVIVSAIPDFKPLTEEEVLVRECLRVVLAARGAEEGGTLLEMCYHPSPDTAITRLAVENGWRVIPGTEAMVWQGLEQDRYWTGREVRDMPVEEVKAAVKEALAAMGGHS